MHFRYFGTAEHVERKGQSKKGQADTYSIAIRFDDGSTDTVEYPSPDVQILTVKGDEAHVEMHGGEQVVAYEGSLSELAVGDLVDCRYQAGKGNNAWFRGRVASVNAAMGTCNVVYYDKVVSSGVFRKAATSLFLLRTNSCFTISIHYQHEQGIPVLRTNLRILERGWANLTWLESLQVPGGQIVKSAEIVNGATSNSSPVLKVTLSGGRTELKTYAEVVPLMFFSGYSRPHK